VYYVHFGTGSDYDDCGEQLSILVSNRVEAELLASLVKSSELEITVEPARISSLDEALLEIHSFVGPSFRALRKRLKAARAGGQI